MFNHIKQRLCLTVSLLGALAPHVTLAQTAALGVQVNSDDDGRRPIVVRPNERTHILANMRKYLIGVQSMTEALAAMTCRRRRPLHAPWVVSTYMT